MTASSSPSPIWPWATAKRTPGHRARRRSAVSSIDSTRLCMKNACPLRPCSRRIARLTSSSSYSPTYVLTGRRPSGGVSITEISRNRPATSARCAGSGWRTSRSRPPCSLSWRNSSFCLTPKRCSSSTIKQPQVLGAHVAREHPVGPDQDVHGAAREAGERRLLLGGRAKARDVLDRDRVVGQAL